MGNPCSNSYPFSAVTQYVTIQAAAKINELYAAVDAERTRRGLAASGGAASAGQINSWAHITYIVNLLNECRAWAALYPTQYGARAVAYLTALQNAINDVRDDCLCYCNYCNCNYCNCNYCQCYYCNCNYSNCSCQYS